MSYKTTGTIHRIDDEITRGNFTSREFRLKVEDGRYTQIVKFELHKERGDVLDNFREGEQVDVEFDVRGRELPDGKCFNSLVAWKVVRIGADGTRKGEPDRNFSRPAERPPVTAQSSRYQRTTDDSGDGEANW